jgi:hypothetical protein
MNVASPEKALLKVLWDVTNANGRPPGVPLEELAERVGAIQRAGVSVYASDAAADILDELRTDAMLLQTLGFLTLQDDRAELTGAGELFAGNLRFPEWARTSMEGTSGTSRATVS